MKTEMGESLIYSWMRHIKRCQITQTNWKSSPEWKLNNEAKLKVFMAEADKRFEEQYGRHVFKGTSQLTQLLRQGEIDALGTHFGQNGSHNLIAVDVAFHAGGLLYGRTKEDTALAVARKNLRAAMCLIGFFPPEASGEILFVSPKVTPATLALMESSVDLAAKLVSDYFPQLKVGLIVNQDFCSRILEPVLKLGDSVADTAELFLRAYQMLDIFNLNITIPK